MTTIVLAGRDPVPAGDEPDWAALVEALREEGAEVAVWAERVPAAFDRLLAHVGARFSLLSWPRRRALSGLLRRRALRRHLLAADARLLHLFGSDGAPAFVAAAHAARVRLVLTPERLPTASDEALSRLLRRADGVEAPSRATAAALAAAMPEIAGRIHVVPPGIDAGRRAPERVGGPRIASLVERWHLDPARRLVLVPGAIRRESGHLLALRATAACSRTDFDLLLLATDRPDPAYARELQALLRATGLGERVCFVEDCADPAAAYAAADLVVVPADAGVLAPRPLLEAQAAGVPVVTTDDPGREDFLLPAVTGWLVSREPGALAAAVAGALELDRDARARLAERCRRFVATDYDLHRSIRARLRAYAALLRPEAAPLSSRPAAGVGPIRSAQAPSSSGQRASASR